MKDKSQQNLQQTQAMLAEHHQDSKAFVQLMKDTYSERFNEDFWTLWNTYTVPVLSESPIILDLGTGSGTFLRDVHKRHPKAHAIGVECAEYMLESVGDLPEGCEIITADLHDPQLPLADNSVDVVVASLVLHEMHQPVRTLQEMQRCLKPGGIFYVMDWVRAPLSHYLADTELAAFDRQTAMEALEYLFIHFSEHNRYSIDDLAFMLENTGFRVLKKTPLKEGRMARLVVEKK